MCATQTAARERNIYRIFAGSTELSPFHQCEALLAAGRSKRLYGLLCRDVTPSGGFGVFDGDDRVGVVTTGARSPYMNAGIGYVRFDNGGSWAGRTHSMRSGTHGDAVCEVVDPPFHDRGKEIPRARLRDTT